MATLWVAGLSFVIIAVVLAIGSIILAGFKSATNDSSALNVIGSGLEAITSLSDFLPLIGLAVAGTVILMIIIKAFGNVGGGMGRTGGE